MTKIYEIDYFMINYFITQLCDFQNQDSKRYVTIKYFSELKNKLIKQLSNVENNNIKTDIVNTDIVNTFKNIKIEIAEFLSCLINIFLLLMISMILI